MTFYTVYNTVDQTYVTDDNQYEPRPPRLYSSVEAAQRRVTKERISWNHRHAAYLKEKARNGYIYSWLQPLPWKDEYFEVHTMRLESV